jgi:hypothetical protein
MARIDYPKVKPVHSQVEYSGKIGRWKRNLEGRREETEKAPIPDPLLPRAFEARKRGAAESILRNKHPTSAGKQAVIEPAHAPISGTFSETRAKLLCGRETGTGWDVPDACLAPHATKCRF